MSNCFDNFIGLRGCSSKPSTSGLYLNDLPGFNLKSMSEVSPDGDALNLFNKKYTWAMLLVADQAAHSINDLRFNTSFDGFVGIFNTDSVYSPVVDEICEMSYALYWASKQIYSRFRVSNVRCMTPVDISGVVIWITDGLLSYVVNTDGAVYKVLTFDGVGRPATCETLPAIPTHDIVANVEYVVNVEYTSSSDKLAVKWIPNADVYNIENSVSSDCGCSPRDGSVMYTYDGQGITADVSLYCDGERFACNIRHEIKYAILYKLAIEVLQEWIASDRMSYFALYSVDWAKEQLAMYEKKYADELKRKTASITKLALSQDRWCFECNKNVHIDSIT